MPVNIVEIISRSVQGITKPFKCRGDDGHIYFVKGYGAGRHSLISELVCGKLAVSFGLPIADFEIVDIPEVLIEQNLLIDIADLGAGLAFGSKAIPHVQELTFIHKQKIPQRLRMDILMFDWWVKNADRTLGYSGGNPNLLWDVATSQLVVIDHNQAFDATFNAEDFVDTHVFKDDMPNIFEDMIERESYFDRLSVVFAQLDEACNNVPHEWWQVDHGVPAELTVDSMRTTLGNILNNNFWRIA